MIETGLIVFGGGALVLALFFASLRIILHLIFGADLPSGVQPLANAFDTVFMNAAAVVLAPFRLIAFAASKFEKPTKEASKLPPKDDDINQLPATNAQKQLT